MFRKSVAFTTLLLTSFLVQGAFIDHGSYTTDTTSGLDWLDLTQTHQQSYRDVVAELDNNGTYSGWRVATLQETQDMFTAFGFPVVTARVPGLTEYQAEFELMVSLFGFNTLTPGPDPEKPHHIGFHGMVAEGPDSQNRWDIGVSLIAETLAGGIGETYIGLDPHNLLEWEAYGGVTDIDNSNYSSTYLIRTSAVPVPAAAWLFGSALIGLMGIKRSKGAGS